MFAGDRAAERDGQFHDLGERERGAFLRCFVGRVEDDGRVRVAVPGVRDDRDRDLPGRGNRLDPGEQCRQLRYWGADVLQHQRAATFQRREERPPRLDEHLALLRRRC